MKRYNIRQSHLAVVDDVVCATSAQTMLGCNVTLAEAEKWLKYYVDGLPETNLGRIANGVKPLFVAYDIIEAYSRFQPWLPYSLRRAG